MYSVYDHTSYDVWVIIMDKTGKGAPCLLCGAIDGKCTYDHIGDDHPTYHCHYVKKKLYFDVNILDILDYWDVLGYLINEAPEGTTLVDRITDSTPPNSITVDEVRSKIPNMSGKLDALLRYLYTITREVFNTQLLTDIPPNIAYCLAPCDVPSRIKALEMLGYLKIERKYETPTSIEEYYGCFTPQGVFRAEELISSNKNSQKVFIAMAFNTAYSDMIRSAIKKGCNYVGYTAETVYEGSYVGDINDRIISEINKSKFVVADYTGNNYGVYYESGYARGRGIKIIETCNKDWFEKKDNHGNKINKLHFDVEHRNMILWENEEDFAARLRDRLESLQ